MCHPHRALKNAWFSPHCHTVHRQIQIHIAVGNPITGSPYCSYPPDRSAFARPKALSRHSHGTVRTSTPEEIKCDLLGNQIRQVVIYEWTAALNPSLPSLRSLIGGARRWVCKSEGIGTSSDWGEWKCKGETGRERAPWRLMSFRTEESSAPCIPIRVWSAPNWDAFAIPSSVKNCCVSWVLTYKAHYAAETKRRRRQSHSKATQPDTSLNLPKICIIRTNPNVSRITVRCACSCAPLKTDVPSSYHNSCSQIGGFSSSNTHTHTHTSTETSAHSHTLAP